LSDSIDYRTLSLCLRASDWGVGLRRSTARTWRETVSQRFLHNIPYPYKPSIISSTGKKEHTILTNFQCNQRWLLSGWLDVDGMKIGDAQRTMVDGLVEESKCRVESSS
jgi:hypothetical protein